MSEIVLSPLSGHTLDVEVPPGKTCRWRIEVLGPGDVVCTVGFDDAEPFLLRTRVRNEANAATNRGTDAKALTVLVENDAFLVTRMVSVAAWVVAEGEASPSDGDAELVAAESEHMPVREGDDAGVIPDAPCTAAVADASPLAAAALARLRAPHEALDASQLAPSEDIARSAVDTFFLNDVRAAEALFAREHNRIPLFGLGFATISFLRALLSFDPDQLRETQARLAACRSLAASLSPPSGLEAAAASAWAAVSGGRQSAVTPRQLDAVLVSAEASLMAAITHLLSESAVGFVRCGLDIRTGWATYKQAAALAGNGAVGRIAAVARADGAAEAVVGVGATGGLFKELTAAGLSAAADVSGEAAATAAAPPAGGGAAAPSAAPAPAAAAADADAPAAAAAPSEGGAAPAPEALLPVATVLGLLGISTEEAAAMDEDAASMQASLNAAIAWAAAGGEGAAPPATESLVLRRGANAGMPRHDRAAAAIAAALADPAMPGNVDARSVVGGLLFGVGGFNIVGASLPPAIASLVRFFGFPADRATGVALLRACVRLGGTRAPLAVLVLLLLFVLTPFFLSGQGRNHLSEARELLAHALRAYPGAVFFTWLAARLAKLERRTHDASVLFRQCSVAAGSQVPQVTDLAAYELSIMEMARATRASLGACERRLHALSVVNTWSRATYVYSRGCALLALGRREEAFRALASVSGLLERRVAGVLISSEAFSARKAALAISGRATLRGMGAGSDASRLGVGTVFSGGRWWGEAGAPGVEAAAAPAATAPASGGPGRCRSDDGSAGRDATGASADGGGGSACGAGASAVRTAEEARAALLEPDTSAPDEAAMDGELSAAELAWWRTAAAAAPAAAAPAAAAPAAAAPAAAPSADGEAVPAAWLIPAIELSMLFNSAAHAHPLTLRRWTMAAGEALAELLPPGLDEDAHPFGGESGPPDRSACPAVGVALSACACACGFVEAAALSEKNEAAAAAAMGTRADDVAVCALIRGTALAALGETAVAAEYLRWVAFRPQLFGRDTYVVPFALFELASLQLPGPAGEAVGSGSRRAMPIGEWRGRLARAQALADRVSSFGRDFNFKPRLQARFHLLLNWARDMQAQAQAVAASAGEEQ
ncbi:hypothetical protein FNF31_03083 [Cafeteria roenbergensis]|uniref:Uncharacterized protein n=1 Tax=Cafeteria roenbergensis TaxID=33653 RepID=A0A5A8DCY2_CAFRO|nr:hypothetical protein FNF31_03083 [Cafeteria roenbergensis]